MTHGSWYLGARPEGLGLTGHQQIQLLHRCNSARKPGNVLVDSSGQPRVIDFGIARRSDVCTLGVILYELLRGDVETIASKALEKDRERRYQSANGLGQDIRRYLNGEPITARPPNLSYQLQIFARRNRPLVVAAVSIVVALVAAAVISTTAWLKADHERTRAEAQTVKTTAAVAFLKETIGSAVPFGFGEDIGLGTVLDQAAAGIPSAFPDDPATEAELHATIGLGYMSLWRWADSERHGLQGLNMRREIYGVNHLATMESLMNMNTLYRIMGNAKEQIDVLEELVQAQTALYGVDHEETLASREELALVLPQQRLLTLARGTAETVCQAREEQLGSEAEQTLAAKLSLATIALEDKRHAEAEASGRELLETARRVLGADNATTLRARSLLGAALIAQGRVGESQALYGDKPAPQNLGLLSSFQGDMGSYTEGLNIYVFWEAW